MFLALVELFGYFRPQIRIQHAELYHIIDLWTRFPAVLDEQNPNSEVSDTYLLRKTFKLKI